MPLVTEARTTPGRRIYAIGDVHGCLDDLREVHARIEDDLARNPNDDWRVVHLGDYVDRGPDSRGVLDYLAQRMVDDDRYLCLMGNHDLLFVEALAGDVSRLGIWLDNGGVETLASYGLSRDAFERRLIDRTGIDEFVPPAHRNFLENLERALMDGDYLFVHAGIDPTRRIDAQVEEDLLWIREPFLNSNRDFGAVVVHGHTPVRRVQVRQNRIGIDTGAVFGGELTCLLLEDGRKARLTPDGRASLI